MSSRGFLLALLVSLVFHALFLLMSTEVKVGDAEAVEHRIETLFKVQLRELESDNFLSRPTQQQLREERRLAMQEQMQEIAQQLNRQTEAQLAQLPAAERDQPLPVQEEAGEENLFEDDQWARNLIDSDLGENAVSEFEGAAQSHQIEESVESPRISLAGRGRGTQSRILANLPPPPQRGDTIVSRSLRMVERPEPAADLPEMEITQPPIQLPPMNEILPSPRLFRPAPEQTILQGEQEAIKALQDQFVQLDDLLDIRLYTYHHTGGDGYFMVSIRPKAADERLRVLPKDVIFVLDASASMGSRRLEVIKEEIKRMFENLRPDDRFNVIGFKSDIKKFVRTLAPVNEVTLRQAWMFISPLNASGRTDIYSSLEPLVQLGTHRARPLIMLLFSDGRPNVGVVDSRRIINNLSQVLGPSASIYCIGTGDRLNRYLLDMLAFRNRGKVAFEKSRSDLPQVVQSVFNYIKDPVLLKVKASFEGLNSEEFYPKQLPDLFLNGELRIWGRLHGEDSLTLRVVGEAHDEQKEVIVKLPIPEIDNATYEIARQWAFHKAYDIIGKMVKEGEKPKFLQQIRELSRTYRIVTPYSEELGLE